MKFALYPIPFIERFKKNNPKIIHYQGKSYFSEENLLFHIYEHLECLLNSKKLSTDWPEKFHELNHSNLDYDPKNLLQYSYIRHPSFVEKTLCQEVKETIEKYERRLKNISVVEDHCSMELKKKALHLTIKGTLNFYESSSYFSCESIFNTKKMIFEIFR